MKDVYRVYEKQRELRHDFHNHILCIKTLLKEKQYEELANYLEELGDRVQSFQRNIVTGNIAADALLEQKQTMLASLKELVEKAGSLLEESK